MHEEGRNLNEGDQYEDDFDNLRYITSVDHSPKTKVSMNIDISKQESSKIEAALHNQFETYLSFIINMDKKDKEKLSSNNVFNENMDTNNEWYSEFVAQLIMNDLFLKRQFDLISDYLKS